MKYDEINYWSEVKLDIVREYAQAYSTIVSKHRDPTFYHIYIDAFSGPGVSYSKRQKGFIPGSPLNALSIDPPFKEFHLIDLDREKAEYLMDLVRDTGNVYVYNGDCNKVLLEQVFPKCRFEDYKRGLCLLDPYGLDLSWGVIQTAGQMKSLEIFLNFPVVDMNRNVLWSHPDDVGEKQRQRMNFFWGDGSWKEVAYNSERDLFAYQEKTGNWELAKGFQERLRTVAGFKFVPDPIPMRNRNSAIVYYLFFASQRPVAAKIVSEIFSKYEDKMS